MDAMLERIMDGGERVFYRHEQRGDADLTKVEKRELLSRAFEENKPLFVQRYCRWMTSSDVPLFAGNVDPMVAFLLQRLPSSAEATAQQQPKATAAAVRNRRYYAMERLKKQGKYFSDEKMRERQPYLYDRMVGQYLSEQERLELRPTVTAAECGGRAAGEGGWAGLLSQFEESGEVSARRQRANEEWDADCKKAGSSGRLLAHVSRVMEMDDEEVEEEEARMRENGEPGESTNLRLMQKEMNDIIEEMDDETAAAEMLGMDEDEDDVPRDALRAEFVAVMEERFLAGKDGEFFDYAAVDNDDSLAEADPIADRDREEKWFDEDDD